MLPHVIPFMDLFSTTSIGSPMDFRTMFLFISCLFLLFLIPPIYFLLFPGFLSVQTPRHSGYFVNHEIFQSNKSCLIFLYF